jgi:hypothetical protein
VIIIQCVKHEKRPRRDRHNLPEPRPTGKEPLLDTASLAQSAKEQRMARILAEAETRYRHELLEDVERMLLLDRIKRLQRRLDTKAFRPV